MLHLLPAGEVNQHDTHPDRRCPCGGHLEVVVADELVGVQFVHQSISPWTIPTEPRGSHQR